MKHGAKNRSITRKILNNNNVHTHTHTHTHIYIFFFWLTNNLKHSINYNKTKFFKQQNIKIETLNRPQHIKKGVAGIENCAKYMCIVAIKVLKHVSAICV